MLGADTVNHNAVLREFQALAATGGAPSAAAEPPARAAPGQAEQQGAAWALDGNEVCQPPRSPAFLAHRAGVQS